MSGGRATNGCISFSRWLSRWLPHLQVPPHLLQNTVVIYRFVCFRGRRIDWDTYRECSVTGSMLFPRLMSFTIILYVYVCGDRRFTKTRSACENIQYSKTTPQ